MVECARHCSIHLAVIHRCDVKNPLLSNDFEVNIYESMFNTESRPFSSFSSSSSRSSLSLGEEYYLHTASKLSYQRKTRLLLSKSLGRTEIFVKLCIFTISK